MLRDMIVLTSDAHRARAIEMVRRLPSKSRVTLQGPKRTSAQERKFRAMLAEVAAQANHCGRKFRVGVWELLFMTELGRETTFLPSLEYDDVVPITYSSADLSVEEMSMLIEIIYAWGVQHSVEFKDDEA